MPTASVPNTFVSGEPAFASAVNGNFAALVNLLNNGLDAGNLVDGAVTSAILANDSVITAKILDGQVTDAKVSLTSAAIPNLDAAKIATGTFNDARIPNLAASKITSGTLSADRIPGLAASKITSGTFPMERFADASFTRAKMGFPTAYTGQVGSNGAGTLLPSGWTSARTATGRYVITHNLGIGFAVVCTTTDSVFIHSNLYFQLNTASSNSFEINARSSTDNVDTGFRFIAVRILN